MSNRKPIVDRAACEAASTSMGLRDVGVHSMAAVGWPAGCFQRTNGRLHLNRIPTATGSCHDTSTRSDFCLCVAAPVCTHTNGATSNSDGCVCGGTGCTPASGLFCYASKSQCSLVAIPDCLVTDGSVANGAACTCNSATCTAALGLYCTSSTSTCSSEPPLRTPSTPFQMA